ncbi:hypothetical protein VTP01DRAFT_9263 [Rhizomucor pusillus]|uniref:uncharacterized protein n=1 Tax=Rhizomucor pusillus TaxID=4840 RepID=UPI003743ABF9
MLTRKRQREDIHEDSSSSLTCRRAAAHVPSFTAKGIYNNEILYVTTDQFLKSHQYLILFFYERDFTPRTVADLKLIESHIEQLSQKAYVMGISTDTELAHKAFLQYKDPTNGLGDTPLHFLLVSDITRLITNRFGILDNESGSAQRAVFIVESDTQNIVYQHVLKDDQKYPMDEIFRILS